MTDEQIGDNLKTWEAWTADPRRLRVLRRCLVPRRAQPDPAARLRDRRGRAGRGQDAAPSAVPLRARHAVLGTTWRERHRRRLQSRGDRGGNGARGRGGHRRALRGLERLRPAEPTSTASSTSSTRRAACSAGCPTSALGGCRGALRQARRDLLHHRDPPCRECLRRRDWRLRTGDLRLKYPYWEHSESLRFDVEGRTRTAPHRPPAWSSTAGITRWGRSSPH